LFTASPEPSEADAAESPPQVAPFGAASTTDDSGADTDTVETSADARGLSFGSPAAAEEAPADPAPKDSDAGSDDTLELGGMQEPADPQPSTPAPKATPDVSPDPAAPAPKIASGGGTLFERMSNLSRGMNRDDDEKADGPEDDKGDEGSSGLNIPRFLDRQSNS